MIKLLPFLLLSSCVGGIDYTASTADGKTERMHVVGLFGGSEAFETAGGTRWTGNRNKSFGQGAQAVTAIAGGISMSVATKSNNALAATKDTNAAATAQQAAALKSAEAQAATAAKASTTSEALKNVAPGTQTPPIINPITPP